MLKQCMMILYKRFVYWNIRNCRSKINHNNNNCSNCSKSGSTHTINQYRRSIITTTRTRTITTAAAAENETTATNTPIETTIASSSSSNSTTTTPKTHSNTATTSRFKPTLSTQELLQLDRQHVWHPYALAGNVVSTTTAAVTTTSATNTATTPRSRMLPIASANNVYLNVHHHHHPRTTDDTTIDQKQKQQFTSLIDGMSNWWATIHGYQHPTLNTAIIQQLQSHMAHVMMGGITHETVTLLCTKLCQLTNLDICFLSDSGSVSVEVAMKMAIQYWNGKMILDDSSSNKKKNRKTKFITVRNGYHGDTFGAMSVCDPINGMHAIHFGSDDDGSNSILQQQYFVPAPSPIYPQTSMMINKTKNPEEEAEVNDEIFAEQHVEELRHTLEQHHTTIAAMILEPIVQGAGGMRMYHPSYLIRIHELCREYNILLIYDEIATGFGRTNALFGYHHCIKTENKDNHNTTTTDELSYAKYKPDIMCLGKALTGGYLSLAATLTTNHVADTIHAYEAETSARALSSSNNNDNRPVLMHGPTFMGNPLACSVALASISLLEQSQPLSILEQNRKVLPPPNHTDTCTDWRRSIPMIEQQLRTELLECCESEHVHDVRVLGAIGVVEMKHPVQNMSLLQQTIVQEYGVWLRPFGKLIYTMPPFIISPDQLRQITNAMVHITRRRF